MSDSANKVKDLLKKQGYSATRPRLAVFQALLGQEPLTMHDLVARAQGVDRASVYRTVELFEKLGIVLRVNIGWKYKLELSEMFSAHHHHLSCGSCGRVIAMNERSLEEVIERLSAEHDFQPLTHQIEVQGRCSKCSRIQKV